MVGGFSGETGYIRNRSVRFRDKTEAAASRRRASHRERLRIDVAELHPSSIVLSLPYRSIPLNGSSDLTLSRDVTRSL